MPRSFGLAARHAASDLRQFFDAQNARRVGLKSMKYIIQIVAVILREQLWVVLDLDGNQRARASEP